MNHPHGVFGGSSIGGRVLPWTCTECHHAGEVAIRGDVRASSTYIRKVHDEVSKECAHPEIKVVDSDLKIITLVYAQGKAVNSMVSPPYPD
jgi:hypothetical protein